jgi:hypothetical protein
VDTRIHPEFAIVNRFFARSEDFDWALTQDLIPDRHRLAQD